MQEAPRCIRKSPSGIAAGLSWPSRSCGGLVAASSLCFRRDPAEAAPSQTTTGLALEPSFTLPEARRTAAFWIMCAIFLGTWSVMFFPFAHFVALAVVSAGTRKVGSNCSPSPASVACSPARDRCYLGHDRQQGRPGHAARSTGDLLPVFASAGSPWPLNIAAAVVGDTFGRAHVGAIAGFAFAFTCSSGSLGPLIAGWIRDQSGSYDQAFLLGAAINALAIFFAIILRRPPRPAGAILPVTIR